MRIKDIMSHPAITCPVDSTMDKPARLMWDNDCGVIPVVDKAGRLAGIITDRDICMAALTKGRALAEIPVTVAMATRLVTCRPEDTLEAAEEMMRESRVRRVPVVDADGYVVGVVALNDFARLAGRVHKSTVDREFVRTASAVCEPRGHAVAPSEVRHALTVA